MLVKSHSAIFRFTPLLLIAAILPGARADERDSKDNADRRERIQVTDEARSIHESALVFDGQNGLPWKLRSKDDLQLKKFDLRTPQKDFHTDIPRLRRGGVGAQFWSIYVPTASTKNGTSVRDTVEQIELIQRIATAYPETFEPASSAEDVLRIHREKRIASLIGIEGGHSLNNSLSVLRMYHKMGARFLTLNNTDNCDVADSACDKPVHQGLSKFGEQVVDEMNNLGMVVDLAHSSELTRKHVLAVSRAPVMFSHTAANALAPHPRNVTDETLRMVGKNHGIVMVNFYTAYLTPEGIKAYDARSKAAHKLRASYKSDKEYQAALAGWLKENPLPVADVKDVANHIVHFVKIAGVDHVGIGSNFDGMGTAPRQLEDVSQLPNLTQELLSRGYTKEQLHKILGGNMLRVLKQSELVSRTGSVRSNK